MPDELDAVAGSSLHVLGELADADWSDPARNLEWTRVDLAW